MYNGRARSELLAKEVGEVRAHGREDFLTEFHVNILRKS
jgi:hypothetical protein